jgi:beta-N-acetylhexosaminidase
VDAWPVSRRAAQLVAVPVLGADPAAVRVALDQSAGAILLLGTVPTGPQLTADLKPAATVRPGPAPMVMVDEEGGPVQRLGADVEALPSPRQMAATLTPAAVQQLALTVGRQMLSLGVTVDLAPVLDLDGGPALSATDPDGPRSFSTDPTVATAYGVAFAAGLQSAGVLAVAKHFPGLGGASGNTDYGRAATPPLTQLERAGLVPFEKAASSRIRAVMVANATVPGLTAQPASVSASVITEWLRDRLHFSGLVMTDSLSAGAISAAGYSVTSAAVAAIEAGADLVLFGSTLTAGDTAQLAPGPLAGTTAGVVSAITAAVSSGALPTARLDQAAIDVVKAKGVDLCSGAGG